MVLGRIDLIRALGLGGIDSVVVASPDDPVRYSRHVRATLEAEGPERGYRAPEVRLRSVRRMFDMGDSCRLPRD